MPVNIHKTHMARQDYRPMYTEWRCVCACVVMALSLVGCIPRLALNRAAMTDVRTIAVVYPYAPSPQFRTDSEEFLGGGLVGFLAHLALAPREQSIEATDPTAEPFLFEEELGDAVVAALKKDGYNASGLWIMHPSPGSFLASYDGLGTNADAVLDLKLLLATYVGSGLRSYAPTIDVEAKLVKLSDKELLFDTLYQYAEGENLYANPNWVHPNDKYLFRTRDDIERNPALAIEGMRAGISIIAKLIGRAFAKPLR